jgi:hypothetical protein
MNSGDAKRQWKAAIKTAWGDRCAYCGRPPIDEKSLTIDHVKPRSRGGEDRTTNCIPACRRCNHAKGSENWMAWYKLQPFYSLEAEIRIRHWLQTGKVINFEDPEMSEWFDEMLNELFTESNVA